MSECSFCGFVGTERQVIEHSGGWSCAEQLRHVREILERQLAESEQQLASERHGNAAAAIMLRNDVSAANREIADLRQQLVKVTDKSQGMTATMQQWRTLAGQMTEERDRVTLLWENAVVYSISLQNQREALKGAVRKIEEEHQSGCRVAADRLRQCVLERDELTRQRDEYLVRVEAWEEGHRLRALDHAKDVARMRSVCKERDALRQQLAESEQPRLIAEVEGARDHRVAQRCPVCGGCGTVPADFYDQLGIATGVAREMCRACGSTGLLWG